ncbi:MAG TPA: glutamate--cysteine ligase [bacterium]|nr:glutamate--cysteine ligase [bacterium]
MLHQISEHFLQNRQRIEDFFAERSKGLTPLPYLSCDIRNSGRKIGVVDTNLFPAGFNNLCNSYSRITGHALRAYFAEQLPQVKNLVLLVEEHTRNRFYLENVQRLRRLLEESGLKVGLAYLGQELSEPRVEVDLGNGAPLVLHRLQIKDSRPWAGELAGDWVLSNNDFSKGVPSELEGTAGKISPSPQLGWHRRRKSRHFELLAGLTEEFARVVDVDPWLLQCDFESVANIDLSNEADLTRLADTVDRILKRVGERYKSYGVDESPYVFVKNDAGTYGMGLMEVMQSDEIRNMNRRDRNKLLSAKGGKKSESFLVQEGIPTADFYSEYPIEPVIYMVGFQMVGGFFRMNAQRDAFTSLNARGMEFACLCMHKLDEPHEGAFLNCAEKENLVRLATVSARLAALAAAEEARELSS